MMITKMIMIIIIMITIMIIIIQAQREACFLFPSGSNLPTN